MLIISLKNELEANQESRCLHKITHRKKAGPKKVQKYLTRIF
jgi:hypothetical protein